MILPLLLSSSSWRKEAQRKQKTCPRAHRKCSEARFESGLNLSQKFYFFSSRVQVHAMFTDLNGDLEPDRSLRMGLHFRWDLNRLPLHQSHWCQCLPTLTQKMYNVKINAMCMNNYRVEINSNCGLEIKKRNGSSKIRLTGRQVSLLFLPWKVYEWKQNIGAI